MKLPAKIEHLEKLIDFVSGCTKEKGFSDKRIKEIELATEEVLVNIFNYAYPEGYGDVEVKCSLDNDTRFIIEISDSGIPFDSLSLADPDVTSDISERKIGGLGVFLVRKIADEVHYRRDEGKNILSLILYK
jgi:serine/threonine-protein kinase RsbW